MPSSASRRALGVAAPARAHRLAHLPPPLHDLVAVQADVLDPAADLQTVLRRAAGHARTLASADTAVVELFADDGLAAMTMSAGLASASRALRSGAARGLAQAAIVSGAAQATADATGDPRLDGDRWQRLGLRSVVCLPLRHRENDVGMLTVACARPRAFDGGPLTVLALLAGQVAAAVARWRLVTGLLEVDARSEHETATREAQFRGLFYENPQPMWVLDAETRGFLAVNHAAVVKYGYSAEEFAGFTIDTLRPDSQMHADFEVARVTRTVFTAGHRLRDGRSIEVEVTAAPIEFSGRAGILAIVNDVTERNRLERELREGAFRDPLTGGPNRALFAERAGHALTRTKRDRTVVAVLYIDLDHFKTVNDSLGYTAGDALLQAVAARLAVALRPGDSVARLSADEFAVLLEDVGDARHAVDVAERLHEAFTRPLEFQGRRLTIGLSTGVAESSSSGPGVAELLRDAELAMHAAKDAGRGRIEVFSPRMQASATERLYLDQDLRQAVERNELRLLYQPLVSIETGAIVGCEALVRWQHPVRGLVSPDIFIPLAEESGMIAAIDTWVLRTACTQMAAWREAGHRDLFVAVNVSGRELGRSDLVDRVEGALFESGLPPDRLEIEVTESTAVAQPAEALEELRQLRRAGISVAIDDFGTGFSSLSKLATLPVDRLKIDRSFLLAVRRASDEDPLVGAMIGLAHRLGLEVTAEGVETQEQLAFLRRSGCDLLQGYLFSPPVAAARFEELLARPMQALPTA